MRGMNQVIAPAGVSLPAANYALAIGTTGAARWLHTAGIVGGDADGVVPPTIGEQARNIWRTIGKLLEEASMPVASIVAVTTYVVAAADLEDRLAAVMQERDRFVESHLAASTLVTVPRLVREEWFVEIAVIAAR
ncbi:hypothetical protein BH24ACT6_BH24ACT6_13900 [soil metagenome]